MGVMRKSLHMKQKMLIHPLLEIIMHGIND
jgi:hypothetical protein